MKWNTFNLKICIICLNRLSYFMLSMKYPSFNQGIPILLFSLVFFKFLLPVTKSYLCIVGPWSLWDKSVTWSFMRFGTFTKKLNQILNENEEAATKLLEMCIHVSCLTCVWPDLCVTARNKDLDHWLWYWHI